MSDRFETCVKRVADVEGLWSDRPADRGGKTMRGVTERTFLEAVIRGILPPDTKHRELTKEQSEKVFRKMYWEPARCGEFPKPLDYCLFDAYVNHRPHNAVKILQRALRVEPDGVIGPKTLNAAKHGTWPALLVARYVVARENFFELLVEEDPTQAANIRGWKNRLSTVHKEAMEDLAA